MHIVGSASADRLLLDANDFCGNDDRWYTAVMADYRRAYVPGGTFCFTVVTADRAPILSTPLARRLLHAAIADCRKRRPFDLDAIVLLPDHLHAIWTLPRGDADFSSRWAAIKAHFTHSWLANGGAEQARTGTRVHARRRGVWQRRFWEHHIRDENDFDNCMNYIHYNPVKHGLAGCPHAWPYSTFERWVERGVYDRSWGCGCCGNAVKTPCFNGIDIRAFEGE